MIRQIRRPMCLLRTLDNLADHTEIVRKASVCMYVNRVLQMRCKS